MECPATCLANEHLEDSELLFFHTFECDYVVSSVADADALIIWPPDVKNWHIGKDPDSGKDWQLEKGATEDKMV